MKINIKAWIVMCTAALPTLSAQTRVDLRTETKSADLSSIGATKPAQAGSTLPATCGTGEVFFLTTAPPGTNLTVCASPNQWTSSGGTLSVQANGTPAGTAVELNFVPGTFVTQTITCLSGTCSYQPDADTTRIPTNSAIQEGQLMAVITTSSSSATYLGVMSANDPLASYGANQELIWNVGATACAGGAMTLNIDGLGAIPLTQSDGVTNLTAAQCLANAPLILTYDAVNTVFRLESGGGGGGGGSAPSVHSPAFSSSLVFSGASSADGIIDAFLAGTLTGNVTSSTCSGFTYGQRVVFIFTQDGTGGHTVAACPGWDNFTILSAANTVTTLSYTVDAAGNGHLDNTVTVGANTFTGTQTAPAFLGSGPNPFLNFPSNTSHSYSSGDLVNNAGALDFNNGTATVHLSQVVASGTATMGASAISSGVCAAAVTVSAANVATTDVVVANPSADPTSTTGYAPGAAGSLYIWAFPTNGNVNFTVCNNTASSITPGAITLNWSVTR